LQRFVRGVDAFSEGVGYFVGWLTTLMVVIVCYDVFTRYVLKNSMVAVQELEWHLFALVFLLGAAFTLKNDGHVRVDVLYTRWSPAVRAWIDLMGAVLFLLPFSLLVIYTSKDFVMFSFQLKEGSPDPGGLPYRWILKSAIPLGFAMLFLQGLSQAAKSFLVLRGAPLIDPNPSDHQGEVH
jgi:TRAP-type mannitol/chloroaromatic compound transport system permease small subunit